MSEQPQTIRELIEQGYAFPALLPEKNDFLLNEKGRTYQAKRQPIPTELSDRLALLELEKLGTLDGYTVPFIAHDYAAKTPLMWNTLYAQLSPKLMNIMLVADPSNIGAIETALRNDPKYLGGGLGVGFKEKGMLMADELHPGDVSSINILVKDNSTGMLHGYNTDAAGFVRSLEEKLAAIGKGIDGSAFVINGAGGVAKEVVRLLAGNAAGHIIIANRTVGKAVALAHEINLTYKKDVAIGIGENMIRGALLNSEIKPAALINLSDKGSDAYPEATFLYGTITKDGIPISEEQIEHVSRDIARYSVTINPQLVYADIVLPKNGQSKSLRIVRAELERSMEKTGQDTSTVEHYILDGRPMVVYQAAPAYVLVQGMHPELHTKKVDESGALSVFKRAVFGE